MKYINRYFQVVLLCAMTLLTGCSDVINGAKDVQAIVEYAKYNQQVMALAIERQAKTTAAESVDQTLQISRNFREQLQSLSDTYDQAHEYPLAKLMIEYTTELMVSTIDHNNVLQRVIYPLKMTTGQRIEQLQDEAKYQQHIQALNELKQYVTELESTLDKISVDVLAKAKQAGLREVLTTKLNEYFVAFADANKNAMLPKVAHLPKLLEQELQWFEYLYQRKEDVSVNEQGQLLFATQQALDDYNSKFGNNN